MGKTTRSKDPPVFKTLSNPLFFKLTFKLTFKTMGITSSNGMPKISELPEIPKYAPSKSKYRKLLERFRIFRANMRYNRAIAAQNRRDAKRRAAAERAEVKRVAAERRAAAERAEVERIAADRRAEVERVAAERRAEVERIAAERRAELYRKLVAPVSERQLVCAKDHHEPCCRAGKLILRSSGIYGNTDYTIPICCAIIPSPRAYLQNPDAWFELIMNPLRFECQHYVFPSDLAYAFAFSMMRNAFNGHDISRYIKSGNFDSVIKRLFDIHIAPLNDLAKYVVTYGYDVETFMEKAGLTYEYDKNRVRSILKNAAMVVNIRRMGIEKHLDATGLFVSGASSIIASYASSAAMDPNYERGYDFICHNHAITRIKHSQTSIEDKENFNDLVEMYERHNDDTTEITRRLNAYEREIEQILAWHNKGLMHIYRHGFKMW